MHEPRTITQALNLTLERALDADPTVMILGEDVGRTGGVFRVTAGLLERFGPARVVDTPVAEAGIVGAALGLAVGGMRPVVELQFMGFSYPALDQVISHVSRMRNRSRHRFTAPLVIRIPYGGGIGAAEHHSESMEALYAHTPGLKVVVPSRPSDAAAMLEDAIADPDPVVFLEPIRLYRSIKESFDFASLSSPIGLCSIERSGPDVTIVAWGAMMKECREAVQSLAGEGISSELVDVRSLIPLDIDTIASSVSKTGRVVVVHEAPRTVGFGGEIAAQLQERCLYELLCPIKRVTGWDTVFPLKRAEQHYLPTSSRIVKAVHEVMDS